MVRLFSKILAKRTLSACPLDPVQHAFLPADGTAENIVLLDLKIQAAKEGLQPLAIAWLDVAKAFDPVSHNPRTTCEAGCNRPETLGHISQPCPRISGTCIARHDQLLALTEKFLRDQGASTSREPAIPTPAGIRRPDLLVKTRGKVAARTPKWWPTLSTRRPRTRERSTTTT